MSIVIQSTYANKWQNQQIKKKFKNRSCGSRAKRAINAQPKSIPNSMIRGWIRRKASRNGKLSKELNRSNFDLRKLQYESVIAYEYMTYGDGHDDYDEYWLDNHHDPWLYSQIKKPSTPKGKIQRKSLTPKHHKHHTFKPKNIQKFKFNDFNPTPPPKPKLVSPPKPASVPKPRRRAPQKTLYEDKEYTKTEQEEKAYTILGEEYIEKMSSIETYGIYSAIEGLADRSTYSSHKEDKADPTSENFKKIMKEIRKQLPQNIYTSINGSMFVRFDENNPRFIQALLMGIDGTPYEGGLFLFDIYLGDDYPNKPLMIKHISKGATACHANNGPGGFSPNLHQSSGKVCLSLLGTWSGPGWEAGKSNVYQVISTIMFMIFGADHPYYMEPSYGGWEGTVIGRKKHERRVLEYDEEVMYHNVKHTMLATLRDPYVGYEDVIRMHFKMKSDWIIKTVERWMVNENYSHAFKEKLKPVFEELKVELNKLKEVEDVDEKKV